ncbi:unnamed protein product [Psylliodes chrysocephalus]|uniref:PH domain-containing protein n=1 Tax=Psylliodes chrysocephalus TaxID=3402493 RepID=A0A9P0G7W2_9CUCU|nr:unnamed protein product [Psylliodes chrysocephala]
MGCEIEQMYLDLNSLLEDICKFLSGDKLGKLSYKDQRLAESLITRSKKQLQDIAKIQPTLQCNEDYVIMNSQDDVNLKPESPIIEEEKPNPYSDLPAKYASQSVKYGIMSMKRRFLLGFEVMKRIYASIHKGWLLIYTSERDMKPLFAFDLKKFEAKEPEGEEKSNFELISTISEKKVYQFLALTHKDMLQWTVQINRYQGKIIRGKSIDDLIISDTISEIKYSNDELDSCSDDEDRIYEELVTVKTPKKKAEQNTSPKNVIKRPPLPPSRISSNKIKGPIKVPPPVVKQISVSTTNSSDGSLASYHEIHTTQLDSRDMIKSNSNSTKSFDDSFSDDSTDSTYETFANVQKCMASNQSESFCSQENEKRGSFLPVKKKSSY